MDFAGRFNKFCVRTFWVLYTAFWAVALVLAAMWQAPEISAAARHAGNLLALTVFAGIIIFCCKAPRLRRHSPLRPAALFFISLTLRVAIIRILGQGTHQVSDFNFAMLNAGRETMEYYFYSTFSNWCMQVKYLALLGSFAELPDIAFYVNAVSSALSSVLIYYIVYISRRDSRESLISALVFSLWPAHALYSYVLSPEHVNIFLILLSVFFVVLARDLRLRRWIISLFLFAAAGAVLALSGFFKATDKVALIALCILFLLDMVRSLKKELRKTDPRWKRVMAFSLLLVSYFITVEVIYGYIESDIGGKVNRNTAPYFLYVGLSPDTKGKWSEEVSEYYLARAHQLQNYDELGNEMTQRLLEEMKTVGYPDMEFFMDKISNAWSNDYYLWIQESMAGEGQDISWAKSSAHFINTYYLLVCIFMLAGVLSLLRQGEINIYMLAGLVVFGFACVLLIGETRTRYKCVVYPYMAMLAGYGVTQALRMSPIILDFLKARKDRAPSKTLETP